MFYSGISEIKINAFISWKKMVSFIYFFNYSINKMFALSIAANTIQQKWFIHDRFEFCGQFISEIKASFICNIFFAVDLKTDASSLIMFSLKSIDYTTLNCVEIPQWNQSFYRFHLNWPIFHFFGLKNAFLHLCRNQVFLCAVSIPSNRIRSILSPNDGECWKRTKNCILYLDDWMLWT